MGHGRRIVKMVRSYRSPLFILSLILAAGALSSAAPTHQLIRTFEATTGGQAVSLPAGTTVEVSSGDSKTAMVRHSLPGGSTTLLFIPVGYLKPLETPSSEAAPSASPTAAEVPRSVVAATPVAAPPKPAGVRLATKDGKSAEGRILRVEKRYVVVLNSEGCAEDLILKDLDKPSQDLVAKWKFQAGTKVPEPDPRVVPGKKISLMFPELGASRSSDPAKIQIRIPENYQPGKPSPLALYFGGGDGTDNCDSLNGFVDSKDWVLVAFPFPKNVSAPLHAYDEGKSGDLIEFQEPMLERLQALLPNTDPERRVVMGTSNGAHMIGIGACDGWKEFSKYFSAFVMHEGGGSESKDFGALRRKSVFVLMGDQSASLGFSKGVVTNVKKANIKPDVFIAQGEGHGMGDASRAAIKEWIAKLPAK